MSSPGKNLGDLPNSTDRHLLNLGDLPATSPRTIGCWVSMALRRLDDLDVPRVYLGGLSAARNEAGLRAAAITHVVDLTASGIDYEGFRHQGVRYLRIDIQDQPRANLTAHIPRINDFVNMARKKHGAAVLLHCSSGNSRSAAAAAAYLVEHCGMTLQRALEVCAGANKLCINVGFLTQLADFEMATMMYRIEQRVPRPLESTLEKERAQVRTTIDLTELAVDQLVTQYENGFICRGMLREVFTRDLCRAALEDFPITETGLVDAMMCLEQQNRRPSNSVREADLAAYENLRADAIEKQKRREQRELEAIREATGDEPLDSSAVADLLAVDAEEKDEAIAKLRGLKTREDIEAQIELDVAEMATTDEGSEEVQALPRKSFCHASLHALSNRSLVHSLARPTGADDSDAAFQQKKGRKQCFKNYRRGPPARGTGRRTSSRKAPERRTTRC